MFAFFLVEIFQEQKQLSGLPFLGSWARWLLGFYNRLCLLSSSPQPRFFVVWILREIWSGPWKKMCEIVCVEKFSSVNNLSSTQYSNTPKVPVRVKSAQIQFTEQICVICDVPGTVPGRAKDAKGSRGWNVLVREGAR